MAPPASESWTPRRAYSQFDVQRTAALCGKRGVPELVSRLGDDERMRDVGFPFEAAHHKSAVRVAAGISQRSPVAHDAVDLHPGIDAWPLP